jgi:hypothetical protein
VSDFKEHTGAVAKAREELTDAAAWLCVASLDAAHVVPCDAKHRLFERIRNALVGELSA